MLEHARERGELSEGADAEAAVNMRGGSTTPSISQAIPSPTTGPRPQLARSWKSEQEEAVIGCSEGDRWPH